MNAVAPHPLKKATPAPVPGAVVGPIVGTPPSLEWCAVDRLSVDPSYQRSIDSTKSQRLLRAMVARWDWALCQSLVVSRRADGSLWVIDGQHRHAGAIRRGDIPHLPCFVLGGIEPAGEARTFVALNEERQRLSQSDIFHGMLAAGAPDAQTVARLLAETGWIVVRSRNTALRKPGELDCAPALVRQLRTSGEDGIRFALSVLRAAWPETPVRQIATLLHGLVAVFDHHLDELAENGGGATSLIARLAAEDPETWVLRGIILRERRPTLTRHTALARVLVGDKPAPAERTPPPPQRHRSGPDPARRVRAQNAPHHSRLGQGLVPPVRAHGAPERSRRLP